MLVYKVAVLHESRTKKMQNSMLAQSGIFIVMFV